MSSAEVREDHDDLCLSEVNYTHGYYGGLNPQLLSFLALWKGMSGVDSEREFTYFELGCGNGVTANVLAAANPHAEFYGNDFNAEHCRNAREVSRAGGLENLTILEKSFADLLEMDLPRFDVIGLHGIYTWVGATDFATMSKGRSQPWRVNCKLARRTVVCAE